MYNTGVVKQFGFHFSKWRVITEGSAVRIVHLVMNKGSQVNWHMFTGKILYFQRNLPFVNCTITIVGGTSGECKGITDYVTETPGHPSILWIDTGLKTSVPR